MNSDSYNAKHLLVPLALFMIFCGTAARAADENVLQSMPNALDGSKQATSDPLQQIPHTLKALEEAKAGKHGKLKSADARTLDKADREIALLMGSHDDLSQLNADEKMRLFNAQETIMAVVSNMRRSRLVCKTVRKVGTRLGTRQCVTADMADAQARAGKETTHSLQNPMCDPGGSNPCATDGFHLRGLNINRTTPL